MSDSHRFPVRVYYEDTDFSQNVYHAAYLKFFERGRTEFLRARRVHHRGMYAGKFGQQLAFAVANMAIDFLRAAHIDDELEVITRLASMSGARIVLDQEILLENRLIVAASVTIAVIKGDGRAVRIPPEMRDLLD